MPALAAERQDRQRRRLDPGMRVLDPRPADAPSSRGRSSCARDSSRGRVLALRVEAASSGRRLRDLSKPGNTAPEEQGIGGRPGRCLMSLAKTGSDHRRAGSSRVHSAALRAIGEIDCSGIIVPEASRRQRREDRRLDARRPPSCSPSCRRPRSACSSDGLVCPVGTRDRAPRSYARSDVTRDCHRSFESALLLTKGT